MTAKEYVKRFTKLIRQRLKGKGLLPSVVLAHALYEASDDDGYMGASALATAYNNEVRAKAGKSWKGPKILAPVRKLIGSSADAKPRKAWYRIYESPGQSITDRIDMLLSKVTHWPKAFLHEDTVRMQAAMLQMLGISDDPRYGERIAMLVRKHKLHWYDRQWLVEKIISIALMVGFIKLGTYALSFWDVWFHGK